MSDSERDKKAEENVGHLYSVWKDVMQRAIEDGFAGGTSPPHFSVLSTMEAKDE